MGLKDGLQHLGRKAKPVKNRQRRRSLTKSERQKLQVIETRPQIELKLGRDERDGLALLIAHHIDAKHKGSLDAFSRVLRKHGGPEDKSVVTRMRNGARPIATSQVAPLVMALDVDPAHKNFALLIDLISGASMLRSLEKLLAKQSLIEPEQVKLAGGKRRAGVVNAAVLILRKSTRDLSKRLGARFTAPRARVR